jgi:mono/diheme cytochrome c family protein
MRKFIVLFSLFFLVISSTAFIAHFGEEKPVPVPAGKQRIGDAVKGFEYLTTGDYVKGGIPYQVFLFGAPKGVNHLQRTGLNAKLSHEYTVVKANNGELLAAPNCMQCHAQVFDGKLIVGLGNAAIDFTEGQKMNLKNLSLLERFVKARSAKEYEAAEPFFTVTKTIAPYLHADVPGVNTADKLAAILVSHRDPETFKWSATNSLNIPAEVIPTDTPPWWLLKKKNAMFYNGFGRGDFGRFLMASNLLTVNDTAEARTVDNHMPDLLAYIYSIEAPKFPHKIDATVADRGRQIFEKNCSRCHGTYGTPEKYPNLLIPASIIKTDSALYESNYSNPQFVGWFNRSWFTKGDHPASLQPYKGYIAPPLDGIWITAPYLHNGSVPTLQALLNSKTRPTYWTRNFMKPEYDYENVGWKFTVDAEPKKGITYNTTTRGGHYFGDKLNDGEREAVIEFLKTL